MRYFSHQEARRFYDHFGAKQDAQSFYEDKAVNTLIQHADFQHAQAVLEFGCGTGRLAERLFREYLPENAIYEGLDISSTMVELAKQRLQVFVPRARVSQTQGETRLPFAENNFDRFVSAYVLDLLSREEIRELLAEAHRLLKTGGVLALASLSHGETVLSKGVTGIWTTIHRINPNWVGGCRPLELKDYVGRDLWNILHQEKISQFGITSEVLLAQPK